MDESWRLRMGMPGLERRRSTEETPSDRTRGLFSGDAPTLDPDDFADVFGGPPRSVLSQNFLGSRARSRSTSFYEEIFRPPEKPSPAKNGRNLPVFNIPTSRSRRSEGFYSDIFGSDDDRKSRTRSKVHSRSTNSSSVLSSEELSPLRPPAGGDVAFSSYASKLRPINVPCRWSSSTMMAEEHPKKRGVSAFPCPRPSYFDDQFIESECNEYYGSSSFGFSRQVTSPETISVEPTSFRSMKASPQEDAVMNSPSSVVSSLCQETDIRTRIQEKVSQDQEIETEDNEVMSSYVIELTSDHRERSCQADAIDEAIAWAKEKFQKSCPKSDWSTSQGEDRRFSETEGDASSDSAERLNAHEPPDGQIGGHGLPPSLVENSPNKWPSEEGKQEPEEEKLQKELELLDEDVKLWSAGNETNIRLLLSTLHHILWPVSGWHPISLKNLVESTHVKKAYQKARLCLHPDKLQQRGATLPQKYVSAKAFSILQDAWAAYLTQDALFR